MSASPERDYCRELDPQINQLTVDDLRPSRLYLVDPAPIPADEMQRTYDWMKSWVPGDGGGSARTISSILNVQQHGYQRAANEPASAPASAH